MMPNMAPILTHKVGDDPRDYFLGKYIIFYQFCEFEQSLKITQFWHELDYRHLYFRLILSDNQLDCPPACDSEVQSVAPFFVLIK